MTKKLFIASPIGGEPCMEYSLSLANSFALLKAAGVDYEYFFIRGCSDLAYARNLLAADFLASDCTDMLWVDADMGWDAEAPLALLNSSADVVGAIYRRRGELGVTAKIGDAGECVDGLFEAETIGLGLTKITRNAYKMVMSAHPELHRPSDHPNNDVDGKDLWRFFRFTGDGDGEDFGFCQMWRALGGRIWLDPSLRTSHIGRCDYEWRPEAIRSNT